MIPKKLDQWLCSRSEFVDKGLNYYTFRKNETEYELSFYSASKDFPLNWRTPKQMIEDENVDIWFKSIYFTATEMYYEHQALKGLFDETRRRSLVNLYYSYAFLYGDDLLIDQINNMHKQKQYLINKKYMAFIVNLPKGLKKLGYEVSVKHGKIGTQFTINEPSEFL